MEFKPILILTILVVLAILQSSCAPIPSGGYRETSTTVKRFRVIESTPIAPSSHGAVPYRRTRISTVTVR